MKIVIITVGKPHNVMYKPAISEFEKRLSKYTQIQWQCIPTTDKTRESELIIKRLEGYVILLDELGNSWSTPNLASQIESVQNNSFKQLTFVIGGAYGVSDAVKTRADAVWSLSKLVFPHQLVRLILIEQLYRAFDLLNNGKYHHD